MEDIVPPYWSFFEGVPHLNIIRFLNEKFEAKQHDVHFPSETFFFHIVISPGARYSLETYFENIKFGLLSSNSTFIVVSQVSTHVEILRIQDNNYMHFIPIYQNNCYKKK